MAAEQPSAAAAEDRINRVELITFHGPGAYTKDKKWEATLASYFMDQCGWPARKFASLPFHSDKRHKVRIKVCGGQILWAVLFSAAGAAGRRLRVFSHEPCGQRTLTEFSATLPESDRNYIVVHEIWPDIPPKLTPTPASITSAELSSLAALMEVD
jgi:hypothetical protein